ncbi:MAG: hypothetical protein JNL87_15790 [Burkholderiaceae bacterium]|nr:hypothetical protein [Burkholderiaceae bacterium]
MRHKLLSILLGLSAGVLAALALPAARAADEFSAAERALFVDNRLGSLQPPTALRYSFRKAGSLEAGFDDSVLITLRRSAEGGCCAASAEFLHGERQLRLPDIDSAQGNPVILYFLERDIREMERLTKGKANYFRKRIRMAVYQGATIRSVQVAWGGKVVDAQEILISPYLDDPLRARFQALATKQYLFTLSDAVPGGVLSIRSRVPGASDGAAPLLNEEMQLVAQERSAAAAGPALVAASPRRQP